MRTPAMSPPVEDATASSTSTRSDRPARKAVAAMLLGNQGLTAFAAFGVNLFAAQSLTTAGRGELALALQLSYLFTVAAVMGLERPFIASMHGRFTTQYRRFISLVAPGAMVLAALVFLGVSNFPVVASWSLMGAAALAGYLLANVLIRGVRVAYISSGDWRPFVVCTTVSQLMLVGGALLLTAVHVSDAVMWMMVYLASGIVPLGIWLSTLRAPRSPIRLPQSEVRRLRRRGWRLLPSDFGNTAMLRSDRLLLPFLGSPSELGMYVTVATVMEMAAWPIQHWADASLHRWSQTPTSTSALYRRIVPPALIVMTLTALALSGVAYLMVTRLLPPSYGPSVTVILPLAVASVVYGYSRIQQSLLIARGASSSVSVVELTGMGVAVVGYVALIPAFGMLGAAYGSIIGYAACSVAGAVVLVRGRRKAHTRVSPTPPVPVDDSKDSDGHADVVIVAHFVGDFENSNNRFIDLATRLTARGARVELVTSSFSHRQKDHERGDFNPELGFRITVIHEPGYRKNISVQRLISHGRMAHNLSHYLRDRETPDIIYCAVPSMAVGRAVARYRRRTQVPLILDVQDLWPEAFLMVLRPVAVARLALAPFSWLADSVYRSADWVIAVSETFAARVAAARGSTERLHTIYLGTDLTRFRRDPRVCVAPSKEHPVRLVYVGTLSHSYDLPTVFSALALLSGPDDPKVEFWVIGAGPFSERYQRQCHKLGVQARFLGQLSYPDLACVLSHADVAVNPIRPKSGGSVLNKVSDYAAAGLPVINSQDCPEYRALLEQYDAGVSCPAADPIAMADVLRVLCRDPLQRARMGMNNRRLANELFDRSTTYSAITDLVLFASQQRIHLRTRPGKDSA